MLEWYVCLNIIGLLLPFISLSGHVTTKSFPKIFLIYSLVSLLFTILLGIKLLIEGPNLKFIYFTSQLLNTDLLFKVDMVSFLFLILNSLIFLLIYLFKLYTIEDKLLHIYLMILFAINNFYFLSGDPITLFLFWEAMLVPTTLILWNFSSGNSKRNALEYIIYNFGLSVFMLLGILILIASKGNFANESVLALASFLIFIGIMVKAPVFPFHGWLENTYYNLPTFITGIFSAVLSKYAIYAFASLIKIIPYLYDLLVFVVLLSIAISALIAISSDDFKKILVYMSMSHVNVMVLGLLMIFHKPLTVIQVVIMGVVHGLVSYTLFLLVQFLQQQTNDLNIKNYGNLTISYPILTGILATSLLIFAGFPITAYFFSEFNIFSATFNYSFFFGILLALGIALNLIYKAKIFYYMVFKKYDVYTSEKLREISINYFLASLILFIGVFLLTLYYSDILYTSY
jgi:formate hydrogenlyase subunit 3/multisubunit Na+/H+ antiporter MnhD subunit